MNIQKKEEWRDVPGYEGLYRVSDLGRVMSLERRCASGVGDRLVRERILKPTRSRPAKGQPGPAIVHLARAGARHQQVDSAADDLVALLIHG